MGSRFDKDLFMLTWKFVVVEDVDVVVVGGGIFNVVVDDV